MNDEFENALAWFSAAPSRWISSAKKDLEACAQWIWEVLQGDFNENATTAQTVTGTVISMIPFVDQICDVRDIIACSKKIKSEPNNVWQWAGLVITLIGLFPVLGSLFKGIGKVMFAYVRRAPPFKFARQFDLAIQALNKFLAHPKVVKALKGRKIDNLYKELAKKLRELSGQVNKSRLMKELDELIAAAKGLLDIVKKRGSTGLAKRAVDLMDDLANLRKLADSKMDAAIKPVKDMLEQLARRLDYEASLAHRARLNALNPHFNKVTFATEAALIKAKRPKWASIRKTLPNKPQMTPLKPKSKEWTATDITDPPKHPMLNAHRTFTKELRQITIAPGTKLYRIVDPNSGDNAICWMSEAEFLKLKSKDDWRKNFAVWSHWNANGEYVTYVVPPGKPLHVWEGVTASQKLGADVVLVGGARQIVVDPAHMVKSAFGPRQKTNWGYDDLGVTNNLVGVPVLTNNWFVSKGK